MEHGKMTNAKKVIDGSYSTILRVTIPMILTVLSANLMYFVDRMLLAGYSLDAMYAAIVGGNFVATFTWMPIGIASASEIFVGQYNGSKQYSKLAIPVWQMIYMSLLSSLIFIPLAYFSDTVNLFPDFAKADGLAYQQPLLYFGCLPSLVAAISAFFIGQGKTHIVTAVVTLGNVINALLAYTMIYKFHQGISGAATATIISQILQVIILCAVFLNKNNRKTFSTLKEYKFNKRVFIDCFKIGLPMSIANFLIILAWSLLHSVMGYTSKELGIVWGIGSNLYVLTGFVAEGLCKSIATISSNMIGQQDLRSIKKVFRSFIIIVVVFCALAAIPLIIFPETLLDALNTVNENISGLYDSIKLVFIYGLITITIESLLYVTWGVLLSGGDTRYPLIVQQVAMWGLVIIPIAVMYYNNYLKSVDSAYVLIIISFSIMLLLFYRRYKSLIWYKKIV